MKILRIEPKKRRYLITFDNQDTCYVTEDTIVRFMLTKGKVLSQEELEEVLAFARLSYGKNLALYYLSFKARSRAEVANYLREHEIPDESIPDIIQNLEAEQWLDDRKFAQHYIDSQHRTGNKGPYVIGQKLNQKGLSKDIIEQSLSEVDFQERLTAIAEKTYQKYQGKFPTQALLVKMKTSLTAKGFSMEQIRLALNHLDFDKEEDVESDLLQKECDKQYGRLSRRYSDYDLKQRLTQTLVRKGFDYQDVKAIVSSYF